MIPVNCNEKENKKTKRNKTGKPVRGTMMPNSSTLHLDFLVSTPSHAIRPPSLHLLRVEVHRSPAIGKALGFYQFPHV